ncbi:hypothetical protein FACS189432_08330 [Bacteroidia bacterium]|nr:hypothetical protein FACS189432_08330 [Bacteroidia bacterium]
MEEIPNKIKNNMGITAEVNLLQDGELYYIEIVVQSYSVPISLRGRYYYRSGSVKQELTGVALSEFLLKKAGQTWDNMPEERATIADIDENTIKKYLRKAETGGRLPDVDGLTTEELLEKLRLAENGKLKRAAIVLFGKDPGKFYPNTFVKIGKFEDDDFTIRFQEVEEGNVIEVLEKVLRTLDYKFLIKNISFEGMNRIETLEDARLFFYGTIGNSKIIHNFQFIFRCIHCLVLIEFFYYFGLPYYFVCKFLYVEIVFVFEKLYRFV